MAEQPDWGPQHALDVVADQLATLSRRWGHFPLYGVLGAFVVFWLRPWWPAIHTPTGWLLVLASVAPLLGIIALIRALDRHDKEPVMGLLDAFLFGSCIASVAALVNSHFSALHAAAFFLLVVGPVEETVKLLAVYLTNFRRASFNERDDGVWYGMAAGAGFAAIETITYVTGADAAWTTLWSRLIVTVPGHILWTAYAGYYLGLAKFHPGSARTLLIKGLLVASAAHGLFDILVRNGWVVPAILLNLGMLWIVWQLVRDHVEREPRQMTTPSTNTTNRANAK